jgi:hypothetical protein
VVGKPFEKWLSANIVKRNFTHALPVDYGGMSGIIVPTNAGRRMEALLIV